MSCARTTRRRRREVTRVSGAGKSALSNLGPRLKRCFFCRNSFKKGSSASSARDRLRDGAVGSECERRGRGASLTIETGEGEGRRRKETGGGGDWGEARSRPGGQTSNAGRVAQTELATRNGALKAGIASPVLFIAEPPCHPPSRRTYEQSCLCSGAMVLHRPAWL